MKIYHSINDFVTNQKTIVTIGTFDGVHIGHQKILQRLTQQASDLRFESVVLTFFPHPRVVLQSGTEMKQLSTIDEKINLLKEMHIDHLIIHPFDKEFSRLTAEDFVKQILVDTLNIGKIIIGYDHRFGRNRTADINDLIAFGEEYNFQVEQISAQEINDVSVSSTKIRNALLEGNVKKATNYLGYPYSITGIIKEGKKLGRTIGFPTANIHIEESYKLIPKPGVYAVICATKKGNFKGMLNIGINPTVSDDSTQKIEVNLFDFNDTLYNQKIAIAFIEFLRDEKKFDSVEQLKTQLSIDKMNALQVL